MVRKITYRGFNISFWDAAFDVLDENGVNAIPGNLSFETVKAAKLAIDILSEVSCRHGAGTPEAVKEFDRRHRLSLARAANADRLAEAAEIMLRSVSADFHNDQEGLALRMVLQDIAKAADPRATSTVPGQPDKIAFYINDDGSRVAADVAYPVIENGYKDPVEVEFDGRVYIVRFRNGCSAYSISAKDKCDVPVDSDVTGAIADLARPLACC
jgi:hypothetical protein